MARDTGIAHMQRSEGNFQESALSFHHVGTGRELSCHLGGKGLFPLSHLVGSGSFSLKSQCWIKISFFVFQPKFSCALRFLLSSSLCMKVFYFRP